MHPAGLCHVPCCTPGPMGHRQMCGVVGTRKTPGTMRWCGRGWRCMLLTPSQAKNHTHIRLSATKPPHPVRHLGPSEETVTHLTLALLPTSCSPGTWWCRTAAASPRLASAWRGCVPGSSPASCRCRRGWSAPFQVGNAGFVSGMGAVHCDGAGQWACLVGWSAPWLVRAMPRELCTRLGLRSANYNGAGPWASRCVSWCTGTAVDGCIHTRLRRLYGSIGHVRYAWPDSTHGLAWSSTTGTYLHHVMQSHTLPSRPHACATVREARTHAPRLLQ